LAARLRPDPLGELTAGFKSTYFYGEGRGKRRVGEGGVERGKEGVGRGAEVGICAIGFMGVYAPETNLLTCAAHTVNWKCEKLPACYCQPLVGCYRSPVLLIENFTQNRIGESLVFYPVLILTSLK